MAKVADTALTKPQRAQESETRHDGYNPLHLYGDRNGEEVSAAIGKKNCTGDQDAEDGPGRSDGGHVRKLMSPECGNGFDYNVENPGANAGQKVITQKATATPDQLNFATEHPEHEHVEQDVP